MIAQLEQHLSSVAVFIPNELISQAGLNDQSEANVSVRNGELVIGQKLSPKLAELIAQITMANTHQEWQTGPSVGGELL